LEENRKVTVYVIRSETAGELYVGMSYDENRRLKDHNAGYNRYTKGLRPWVIVHTEVFSNWKEARTREKQLKSGSGKEYLKKLIS
jgi:predicted GIY-YIG superfamily endonuclease